MLLIVPVAGADVWMVVLVLVFEGDEIGAEKDDSGRSALNVVFSVDGSGDVFPGPNLAWLGKSSRWQRWILRQFRASPWYDSFTLHRSVEAPDTAAAE